MNSFLHEDRLFRLNDRIKELENDLAGERSNRLYAEELLDGFRSAEKNRIAEIHFSDEVNFKVKSSAASKMIENRYGPHVLENFVLGLFSAAYGDKHEDKMREMMSRFFS